MLRRGAERRQLLPPDGQQHAARRGAERVAPPASMSATGRPAVARLGAPGGRVRRSSGRRRGAAAATALRRDLRGERMGGVDQRVDRVRAQIGGKPVGAAEAADAVRDRRQRRVRACGRRARGSARTAHRRRAARARAEASLVPPRIRMRRACMAWVRPVSARRWLDDRGDRRGRCRGAVAPRARALIAEAGLVVGGARHLALAAPLIRGGRWPGRRRWPTRCRPSWRDAAAAGRGAGLGRSVLVRRRHACWRARSRRRRCSACPRPRRSRWPARGSAGRCRTSRRSRSAAGRSSGSLPLLQPGAACWRCPPTRPRRPRSPRCCAARGSGRRRCMCWRRSAARASASARRRRRRSICTDIDPLNLRRRSRSSRCAGRARSPLARGLDDDAFEHDGQITKREIRAVTLSALAPRARRDAVGYRLRLRLDRHRVDAAPSRQPRGRRSSATPTARRAGARATRQRSACRACASSTARRRRRSPACRRRTRCSSAAARSDAGVIEAAWAALPAGWAAGGERGHDRDRGGAVRGQCRATAAR